MTTISFYDDPVDGRRVMRSEPDPKVAAPVVDVRHEYDGPMKPEEAAKWAKIVFVLCLVIAVSANISTLVARFAAKNNAFVQSDMFASIAFPLPWTAVVSAPAWIIIGAYLRRKKYDDGMIARFVPEAKGKPDKQHRGSEPETVEDDGEGEEGYSEDDALYAQMAAIIAYAHKNGGPAPVPVKSRNGVASLPLGTGGTLDANGYAIPANKLAEYGLLVHGKNNTWQLADRWRNATLQELGAELRRQVDTNG